MLIVRVLTSEGVFRDALSNDLLTSMIGGDTAGSSGQRIVCEVEVGIWGWEELRRFGLNSSLHRRLNSRLLAAQHPMILCFFLDTF